MSQAQGPLQARREGWSKQLRLHAHCRWKWLKKEGSGELGNHRPISSLRRRPLIVGRRRSEEI